MIAFRKRHRVLRTEDFYRDQDIVWFSPTGKSPVWGDNSRTLGCMIHPQPASAEMENNQALSVLFNADSLEVKFRLPAPPGGKRWHVAVDTARPSPHDLRPAGQEELLVRPDSYRMQPRSMVILIAK
jgi:isoamylase